MEFTYQLTEDDFVAANQLKLKSVHRIITSVVVYSITTFFWIGLTAIWINPWLHPHAPHLGQDASALQSSLLPGALSLALWILIFRVFSPYFMRRKFRKAQNLRGEFISVLNSEGLAEKSSKGSSTFSPWADFAYWRESKTMIIVVSPTDVFHMLPKSGLSDPQQTELRAILTTALPKK